mgnify:CR=1 FL=1
MTLQQCKDYIARKYSVDNFNLTVWMTDEAAELYAILKESPKEEESQEELWDEAQLKVKENLGTYSNDLVCDLARWAIEALKPHYNLTRKP